MPVLPRLTVSIAAGPLVSRLVCLNDRTIGRLAAKREPEREINQT